MTNFFMSIDDQGGKIPFITFGFVHIIWMIAIAIVIFLITTIYKGRSEIDRILFRKRLSLLILFTELLRKYTLIAKGDFTHLDVPLHLCSISIILVVIHAYRASSKMDDAQFMLVLPGALAALLFPDWNTPLKFNFYYLHSWIIHGLLVLYPVMLLASKDLIPNRRNLPAVSLGLGLFAIPIYFINKAWNTNFLFINTPSEGSPLVFLEKILGNPGYIFGLATLALIVWLVMYWISDSIIASKPNRTYLSKYTH